MPVGRPQDLSGNRSKSGALNPGRRFSRRNLLTVSDSPQVPASGTRLGNI
nr:MAG TPA: hypothetical protein [Caudoviricetes sp.]